MLKHISKTNIMPARLVRVLETFGNLGVEFPVHGKGMENIQVV